MAEEEQLDRLEDKVEANKLKEKLRLLEEREKEIDKEIESLLKQGVSSDVNAEIRALHKYNEMKDLTQNIIEYLAMIQCTTLSDIHKRYNLPLD